MNLTDVVKRARAQAEAFPLISIQQVAKLCDKSVRTLRRWEAGGLMPPRTKHGRCLKYNKAEIAEMMAPVRKRCGDDDADYPV